MQDMYPLTSHACHMQLFGTSNGFIYRRDPPCCASGSAPSRTPPSRRATGCAWPPRSAASCGTPRCPAPSGGLRAGRRAAPLSRCGRCTTPGGKLAYLWSIYAQQKPESPCTWPPTVHCPDLALLLLHLPLELRDLLARSRHLLVQLQGLLPQRLPPVMQLQCITARANKQGLMMGAQLCLLPTAHTATCAQTKGNTPSASMCVGQLATAIPRSCAASSITRAPPGAGLAAPHSAPASARPACAAHAPGPSPRPRAPPAGSCTTDVTGRVGVVGATRSLVLSVIG